MRRLVFRIALGTAMVALPGARLVAQGADEGAATPVAKAAAGANAHAAAPVVHAARIESRMAINARLDEPQWATAVPITSFTQTDPTEGEPATERTEVRILYDAEAIYVGARMYDASGKVSTRLGRRDSELEDSDWFIVVFDSYHYHQGGFRFKLNPSGVKGDEANGDRSWNPVWESATSIDSEGWTAEFRIPFSQLRFNNAPVQEWGIQFYREVNSKAENTVFSFSPKRDRGGASRFGHLQGIEGIVPSHRLELLPYAAARAEYREVARAPRVTFDNPFRDGSDMFGDVGADLKYRPTSNLTLDVTINPDFGQIEADEPQVNLSANESFFMERRPFFIEGSNIFRFGTLGAEGPGGGGGGAGQIFYSRRVGREPQGSLPSTSRYSDMPLASTILGAAKLSGRTAGGWSIGIMEAVTARENAPWVDSTGLQQHAQVEPLSNYFVSRIARAVHGGQGNFGVILTTVHRDLEEETLASRLRSSAYTAGIDGDHELWNRTWSVGGAITGTHIRGRDNVITAAQRGSARYFQRPDADYLSVDSAATSLAGFRAAGRFAKIAGQYWRGSLTATATSPGYETNDLGFQSAADRVQVNLSIDYDERNPGRTFRTWGVGIKPDMSTNFGGDVIGKHIRLESNAQLLNYWSGRIEYDHEFESLDDRFTRGGPLAITVPEHRLNANISSDNRRKVTINMSGNERWNDAGGWSYSRSLRFGFKPADFWSGEIGPSYSRNYTVAQYVTSVADPLATATFGRRYIFADLRQTTLSMTGRLNVTFTPDLTFQLVAQPFISSGRYDGLKEFSAPRTYSFLTYGRDIGTISPVSATGRYSIDPDSSGTTNGPAPGFTVSDQSFNTRTLAGTAALRYEWRPGSTVHVVWQQARRCSIRGSDRSEVPCNGAVPDQYGGFSASSDSRALWRARPDNVFQVKISYWVNP